MVSIVKTKQRKPFFNSYSPLWKPEKSALFCHEMPDIFRICLRYKVNQLSLVIFISQKSWKKKFLEFFQLCLFFFCKKLDLFPLSLFGLFEGKLSNKGGKITGRFQLFYFLQKKQITKMKNAKKSRCLFIIHTQNYKKETRF